MNQDEIAYSYAPQGPVLEQYLLSRAPRTIIRGPLGSGKTNASCWKGFRIACDQEPDAQGVRRTRGIAVRNTYSDLLSTTIKDWLDMFDGLGRYVGGGREPPTHYLAFDLDDGTTVEAEVIFIAFDREEHVKKARGLQATWVWLNETKELVKPVVDMLDLRVGRYPKDVTPTWYGMFGDTNSPDTDHWLYRLAEEDRPEGWCFLVQPGGVLRQGEGWAVNPQAENIDNLPANYYERGLQGKKEDWIKVNLANEYGFVMDGRAVHPGYADSMHCRQFDLDPRLPLLIGMDFGLTPAAVFGQRRPMGGIRVRSELVATSMGAKAFAQEIHAHLAVNYSGYQLGGFWGDPSGDSRSQADDEQTPFKMLRAAGLPAIPAPTNDFLLRTEAVDQALGRLIDGEPGLVVHPDCKTLRKALSGGYCYRRLQISGERFADKPDKGPLSHVAEALQYLAIGLGEHKPLVKRPRDPSAPPRQQYANMD